MIVFLFNVYLLILFLLVWFKVVPVQPFLEDLASLAEKLRCCLLGLHPSDGLELHSSGEVLIRAPFRPDQRGRRRQVIEVPVTANTPLKAQDILVRIDPTPI